MNKIIVAFETAVGAGSIALLDPSGEVLALWSGEGGAPMSGENTIPRIESLMVEGGYRPNDIGTIVTSAGPGSFTGIRVGIATAFGLGRALDVEVSVLPLLQAMQDGQGSCMTAIPMGRGMAAYQNFVSDGPEHGPASIPIERLPTTVEPGFRIMHADLFEVVGQKGDRNAGSNMARALAGFALRRGSPERHKPIFLSKPDVK